MGLGQTGTNRPKTKIVCTLGPATSSEGMVEALVESGMSIARLNLSHGALDEHRAAAELVGRVSDRLGIPVGIMVDVPGLKYRTGPLGTGVLDLRAGDKITLTSRDVVGTSVQATRRGSFRGLILLGATPNVTRGGLLPLIRIRPPKRGISGRG